MKLAPDQLTRWRPSRGVLVVLIAGALVTWTAIELVLILPVVLHLDPTGIGKRMGLMRGLAGKSEDAPPPVHSYSGPYRSDEIDLTVLPFGDLEYQVNIEQSGAMVYAWKASSPVEFDFHGEAEQDPDHTVSYGAGTSADGNGLLQAPFTGAHGWYWLNHGKQQVNIQLKIAGFYKLSDPIGADVH